LLEENAQECWCRAHCRRWCVPQLFVQSPSYRILNLPVIEYLNVIRRQSLLVSRHRPSSELRHCDFSPSLQETVPVVSVKPDDTLGKAVAKVQLCCLAW
jgi:hypothetical protein